MTSMYSLANTVFIRWKCLLSRLLCTLILCALLAVLCLLNVVNDNIKSVLLLAYSDELSIELQLGICKYGAKKPNLLYLTAFLTPPNLTTFVQFMCSSLHIHCKLCTSHGWKVALFSSQFSSFYKLELLKMNRPLLMNIILKLKKIVITGKGI